MKNSKILSLLLISNMHTSAIKVHDNSNFKNLIKPTTEKLQKSAHQFLDWAEYYRIVCAYNLSDWIDFCRSTAKNNTNICANFIQNENNEAFRKLNKAEQEAIRDLNNFYKDMAHTSKQQQEILMRSFAIRWKECQRIFKKAVDHRIHFKETMRTITEKLNKSDHSLKAWSEYYAKACANNLSDWVDYCRASAKNEAETFNHFIQNENSAAFKMLPRSEQKALKSLNKFYKKFALANKEKQEILIHKFSKRWKEYQHIFNNAKDKVN